MPIRVEHQPSGASVGMAAYLTGAGHARKEKQKQALDWWQQERRMQQQTANERMHMGYQGFLQGQRQSWEGEQQKRLFEQQSALAAEHGEQRIDQDIYEGMRRGQLALPPSAQKELEKINDNRARLQGSDKFNDEEKAKGLRQLAQRERRILRGAQRSPELTPQEELEKNSVVMPDGSRMVRNRSGGWDQIKPDTSKAKEAAEAKKEANAAAKEQRKAEQHANDQLERRRSDYQRRIDALEKEARNIDPELDTDGRRRKAITRRQEELYREMESLGIPTPGQAPKATAPDGGQPAPDGGAPPAAPAPQAPPNLFNPPVTKPQQPAAPAVPPAPAPAAVAPQNIGPDAVQPGFNPGGTPIDINVGGFKPGDVKPLDPKDQVFDPSKVKPINPKDQVYRPGGPISVNGVPVSPGGQQPVTQPAKPGISGVKAPPAQQPMQPADFSGNATATAPKPPMITGLPDAPLPGNVAEENMAKKGREYVPMLNEQGAPTGQNAWRQAPPTQTVNIAGGRSVTGQVYRQGDNYVVRTPTGDVTVPVGFVTGMDSGQFAMTGATTSTSMTAPPPAAPVSLPGLSPQDATRARNEATPALPGLPKTAAVSMQHRSPDGRHMWDGSQWIQIA